MRRFRNWLIKKLGGYPKESADIVLNNRPIIREERAYETLKARRVFLMHEWEDITGNPEQLELVKMSLLKEFAKAIYEHQDDFINWRVTEHIPILNMTCFGTRLDASIDIVYKSKIG